MWRLISRGFSEKCECRCRLQIADRKRLRLQARGLLVLRPPPPTAAAHMCLVWNWSFVAAVMPCWATAVAALWQRARRSIPEHVGHCVCCGTASVLKQGECQEACLCICAVGVSQVGLQAAVPGASGCSRPPLVRVWCCVGVMQHLAVLAGPLVTSDAVAVECVPAAGTTCGPLSSPHAALLAVQTTAATALSSRMAAGICCSVGRGADSWHGASTCSVVEFTARMAGGCGWVVTWCWPAGVGSHHDNCQVAGGCLPQWPSAWRTLLRPRTRIAWAHCQFLQRCCHDLGGIRNQHVVPPAIHF